jgi:hypothetical protein
MRIPTLRQRSLILGLMLAPVLLAGCGPGGPAGLVLALALSLSMVAACSSRTFPPEGTGVPLGTGHEPPPGEEPGGTYEQCCENGRLTSCYCPPMAACNYGWGLVDCGDGTCVDDFNGDAACPNAQPDAGPGGTYEECCQNGVLTTCYCPPNAACNYGLGLNDCGNGTCTYDATCPGVDAGVPPDTSVPDGGPVDGGVPPDTVTAPDVDGGGTYETCCENGVLTTCYCPPNTACNYGLGLVDCGDGTCVYEGTGQTCSTTSDGGAPDV